MPALNYGWLNQGAGVITFHASNYYKGTTSNTNPGSELATIADVNTKVSGMIQKGHAMTCF